MGLTAQQAANAVREAYQKLPGGGLSGVNVTQDPNYSGGPLQSIKSYAVGAAKGLFSTVQSIIPGVNVLGTVDAARGAANATKSAAQAAESTLRSASAGIKQGLSRGIGWAVFVLLIVVGLWAWNIVRPR